MNQHEAEEQSQVSSEEIEICEFQLSSKEEEEESTYVHLTLEASMDLYGQLPRKLVLAETYSEDSDDSDFAALDPPPAQPRFVTEAENGFEEIQLDLELGFSVFLHGVGCKFSYLNETCMLLEKSGWIAVEFRGFDKAARQKDLYDIAYKTVFNRKPARKSTFEEIRDAINAELVAKNKKLVLCVHNYEEILERTEIVKFVALPSIRLVASIDYLKVFYILTKDEYSIVQPIFREKSTFESYKNAFVEDIQIHMPDLRLV
jgi:hypothetical protein